MITVKETAPHNPNEAPGDNYGANHQGRISAKDARALCGMYQLPLMGYETVVAVVPGARLYVANMSGAYFLRSPSVPVHAWPVVFGVTLERFKLSDKVAREMLYDWHGGQSSPFYAAASSGLVESFDELAREARAVSPESYSALSQWIEHQRETAKPVVVQGREYFALPWASKTV